jgi:hypothetical protein
LLFVILFWPPCLGDFAQRLGVMDILRKLQTWISPFFTANYLS